VVTLLVYRRIKATVEEEGIISVLPVALPTTLIVGVEEAGLE
jgi:hypothetical protein